MSDRIVVYREVLSAEEPVVELRCVDSSGKFYRGNAADWPLRAQRQADSFCELVFSRGWRYRGGRLYGEIALRAMDAFPDLEGAKSILTVGSD